MKILIASDHGGYETKKFLIENFESKGFRIHDFGPDSLTPEDDYPDYVFPLVNEIQYYPESMGILLCRNGVGVSMMANKFEGIKCALSWNIDHAISSRKDDNTNVLALPADYISKEEALSICFEWLKTPFSGEERHKRRLGKFMELGTPPLN